MTRKRVGACTRLSGCSKPPNACSMVTSEAAVHWVKTRAKALGGVSPLQYADNEAAADVVIGRLEYGVIT